MVPENVANRSAVAGVIPRRALTNSLTRCYGTRIPSATSRCDSPMGFRNSSRSISPGCDGEPCAGIRTICASSRSLLIVHELNPGRAHVVPREADPVLVADADAELPLTGALQGFESIRGGAPSSPAGHRQYRQVPARVGLRLGEVGTTAAVEKTLD